jgi:hypothetical protein
MCGIGALSACFGAAPSRPLYASEQRKAIVIRDHCYEGPPYAAYNWESKCPVVIRDDCFTNEFGVQYIYAGWNVETLLLDGGPSPQFLSPGETITQRVTLKKIGKNEATLLEMRACKGEKYGAKRYHSGSVAKVVVLGSGQAPQKGQSLNIFKFKLERIHPHYVTVLLLHALEAPSRITLRPGQSITWNLTVTHIGKHEATFVDNRGRTVVLRDNCNVGPIEVERIYPDRVKAFTWTAFPAGSGPYPITLGVGQSTSALCVGTATLTHIGKHEATFIEKIVHCANPPVCLAEDTLVLGPDGMAPVQLLREGARVWTADRCGGRVPAVVLRATKTLAPPTHSMVHVALSDGRELDASPGHPTADGRTLGDLSVGDSLDGSRVLRAERRPYRRAYTYDLLPSGEKGLYWANGILLASTLR